ncbi:YebC/PmpR family DNA-binding transcriptional regulator [Spiroplasma endosymbiont of Polydrusus formosus]|uniref:YebC/PmpR family DNA-binding transcriptional regulator n=1 Tax=Spiroplasma endosymbiont of Polydrusus formosus TaxID=3139326 RepID=UPI0035B54720
MRYERYGPKGWYNYYWDILTNNVNRAVSEVNNCFTKQDMWKIRCYWGCCISHLFDNLAVFTFDGKTIEEMLDLLLLADCDINDISLRMMVKSLPYKLPLPQLLLVLKHFYLYERRVIYNFSNGRNHNSAMPHERIILQGNDIEQFKKMLNMLDEIDDIQDVYHNIALA